MSRSGIMLAVPFEEQRLQKWNDTVIVQPKLDGERCRGIVGLEPILVSSEGEIKNFACPHLVQALREIFFSLGRDLELDGELYIHGESHPEIHSIVSRTTNLHPLYYTIEYHVFDLIDETKSQLHRLKELKNISLIFPSCIKLVPSIPAENLGDVREIFSRYISDGYEGIIIRHCDMPYVRKRSTFMMKFKPKKEDEYEIIGYVEGTGKYLGTIGAILCRGDDGTTFEVGSFSINDSERKLLWNMRAELTLFNCRVGYQHKLPSGKPKSSVFLSLTERPKVEFINPFL